MATASGADSFANTIKQLDCFCSWVHYNLLEPPEKRIEQPASSCHEMGSRQKAVKAFLAVCADTMLDRWIPGQDWVRQIWYNGGCDSFVLHLNMGMSKQCVWQNKCATLLGQTIFYNKKNTSKSRRLIMKKKSSFYYVLGAGPQGPRLLPITVIWSRQKQPLPQAISPSHSTN
jgi:hypothetical protein